MTYWGRTIGSTSIFFVEFFIEHLCDLSRTFPGDIQETLVLALVGQVYTQAINRAVDAGINPLNLPPNRLSLTATSIADVTGIPRETARRKLASLERRGWLLRNQDGSFRIAVSDGSSIARKELSELDTRTMERVARMFRDIEAIIAHHTAAAPATGEAAQFGLETALELRSDG